MTTLLFLPCKEIDTNYIHGASAATSSVRRFRDCYNCPEDLSSSWNLCVPSCRKKVAASRCTENLFLLNFMWFEERPRLKNSGKASILLPRRNCEDYVSRSIDKRCCGHFGAKLFNDKLSGLSNISTCDQNSVVAPKLKGASP